MSFIIFNDNEKIIHQFYEGIHGSVHLNRMYKKLKLYNTALFIKTKIHPASSPVKSMGRDVGDTRLFIDGD